MGLDNPVHIAFLVVILLLLFGAKRLPEIGRQLGSGMREFKDSVTGSQQAQPAPQQAALPQPTQVAAQPAPAPAPPAAPVTAQPVSPPAPAAAPAPVAAPAPGEAQAAAPAPQPAAPEPTHQA
jgi:TatA/E family protein of Tat protein translocase